MSVQAIVWVLEEAPGVKPHLVSTLIGFANHADRKGKGSHPSQATLSFYTRKMPRRVRRDIEELKEAGLIRLGDQRLVAHLRPDRRPVVYDLAMEKKRTREAPDEPPTREEREVSEDPPSPPERGVPEDLPPRGVLQDRAVLQGRHGGSYRTERGVLQDLRTNYKPTTEPTTSLTPARDEGLTEIPDDFRLTDAMRRWAHRDGYAAAIDIDHETAQFISYWRSEGRRKKSWPDAWMKWIRDAHQRTARPGRVTVLPRPTPQSEREAMFERAMQRAIAREAAEQ